MAKSKASVGGGPAGRQKPSPIPPPPSPEDDLISDDQYDTLFAIVDAIVPSLTPEDFKNQDTYNNARKVLEDEANIEGAHALATAYLAESASSLPEFKAGIGRLVNLRMPADQRKPLLFILSALNTRAGCLVLTGYTTIFKDLPREDREKIIQNWALSRFAIFRGLNRSLTFLGKLLWARNSPTLGQILSFPKTPTHDELPKFTYPFEFIQIPEAKEGPEILEADIVIVGSGCGGAVAAKVLAEAGAKVIVVEKSYYWKPEHLPMNENEGQHHLFLNAGATLSDDSSMAILAGSAWGGGGTVNWSASLHAQGFVRREWATKHGLTHFLGADFQADMDAVCERMGVGIDSIKHNKTNRVLLDGARKLGWNAKPVPQNTGGETHYCGYCTYGCGSAGKKGPTETFLPDAAKAGARFIEGYSVDAVIFEQKTQGGNKVVKGVRGTWTSRDSMGVVNHENTRSRELIIHAPRVIASGGTLETPVLLRKSGLTNYNIGRNLHLHPVSWVGAVWDEDVRPWEGGILTSVVSEFENLDGEGYGVKLEAMTMVPSVFLASFPWTNGLEYKEFCSKMKRMTGYISISRDRDSGMIYPDPKDQRVRIAYTPSQHDKNHILEGVVRLAEICYVEGAREIYTTIPGMPPYVRPADETGAPSVNDPAFSAWTQKVRAKGLPTPDVGFGSAHQMGSCIMGTSAKTSVVDARGKVWGTNGLYICDASVFPTATGVNPMITCMGISRGTARGIVDELHAEGSNGVKSKL